MKRAALILLAPTVAVCRYGCASCCAAPITVLWLAGIVAIVLGFLGGPAEMAEPSWGTVGLGLALWAISSLWTAIATRGSSGQLCEGADSAVCQGVNSGKDDPEHLDKIHGAR
jgi:hypothetical protein